MREKINLQELTALLSDKAGITKKEADAFLREFFGLMTESLLEDKIVKIRDLGTFKLTDVEARESVDVRTGERFLIAAHSKVSFNPDKTLSEIINKPYEQLEPELIEEDVPIIEEDVPVDDVSEMLPEFDESNESNESNEEDKPLENNNNNIESKEEEKSEEKFEEKLEEKSEEKSEDDFPEEKKRVIEDYNELADETIQKKRAKIKTVVFTFLTVGILVGIFYYLTRETGDTIHYPSTTYKNKAPIGNETKNNPAKLISTDDTTITVNPEDTMIPIKNTLLPGKKRLTRVADRLTMISYEEYGDVVFWIYIYDENKYLISKDNYVKAGIEITIPPPEKYDIDANDPKSLQKARDFARTYNEKHPNPPLNPDN